MRLGKRPRSEWQILYDLLRVLEKRNEFPTPLRILFERAKVKTYRQQKHLETLRIHNLILASGDLPTDTAVITQKGLLFIANYENMMRQLGIDLKTS